MTSGQETDRAYSNKKTTAPGAHMWPIMCFNESETTELIMKQLAQWLQPMDSSLQKPITEHV